MNRVMLQEAQVLHRRSYRETSILAELFTKNYGRISIIAKGAKRNHSNLAGLLQPFIPLTVSWCGNGELYTLTHAELAQKPFRLKKNFLFSGLYLNELLMALLQKLDPHPNLYMIYQNTLAKLEDSESLQEMMMRQLDESILRRFEKYLLEELGYGLLSKSDPSLKNAFNPDQYYQYVPLQGFIRAEANDQLKSNVFIGKSLIAIINEEWNDEESLKDAKRLSRLFLAPLLGDKMIHSRQLFNNYY